MFRHIKVFRSIYTKDFFPCSVCFMSQVQVKQKESTSPLLINCKNRKLNFREGEFYEKFDAIPLASKGWKHRKSVGDFFTLFPEAQGQELDETRTFSDLGVNPAIIKCLEKLDIKTPTEIQAEAYSTILSGKNSVLAAETGCGKTLAYLIPMLQQILNWRPGLSNRDLNSPLGLILLPSRELAQQIGEIAAYFAEDLELNTRVIIGGKTKRHMMNPTFESVDLLVATFGAISKLTTTGIYRMSHVHHLVMDEADTLLDDSFNEKLKHFLKKFKIQYGGLSNEYMQGTQLTLVSATMPKSLTEIFSEIMPPESLTNITTGKLHRLLPHVPQKFLRIKRSEKPIQLLRIAKSCLNSEQPLMIFSNKTATCDWVSLFLNENNIPCVNLNGDMNFEIRQGKFKQFQNGIVNVISCTDIGSRGLDTVRVKQVLNFDFPLYAADYIHRCGRTGRIGSSKNCLVTNFITAEREVDLVQKLELSARTDKEIPNVNGNITQIITNRALRAVREDLRKMQ